MSDKKDYERPVPREDFARWLASGEPAATIGRWAVYRLPAIGLGEEMDSRLEAVYGFELRERLGADAWFWGMFESEYDSRWTHEPEAGPLCLHDSATGDVYHVTRNARQLFEAAGNWEEAIQPERALIAACRDKANAIAAELLVRPETVQEALEAFEGTGDEAFSEGELPELMGRTFVITGGFDRDFVADVLRRCETDEPWGPALAEALADEDRAAQARADSLLSENAAWFGGAIRRQREWDEAVREHGGDVAEAMAPSASLHTALCELDAKKVLLVFRTKDGEEAVARIGRQRLLADLEGQIPLRIPSYCAEQLDDCSSVIDATSIGIGYFDLDKLEAVRFRGKDVWTKDVPTAAAEPQAKRAAERPQHDSFFR